MSGIPLLENFYGVQNKNLKIIKSNFRQIKIIPTDYQLKGLGNLETQETFERRIDFLNEYLKRYHRLNGEDIETSNAIGRRSLEKSNEVILRSSSSRVIHPQKKTKTALVEVVQKK